MRSSAGRGPGSLPPGSRLSSQGLALEPTFQFVRQVAGAGKAFARTRRASGDNLPRPRRYIWWRLKSRGYPHSAHNGQYVLNFWICTLVAIGMAFAAYKMYGRSSDELTVSIVNTLPKPMASGLRTGGMLTAACSIWRGQP